MQPLEFPGRENVNAQVQVVLFGIDEAGTGNIALSCFGLQSRHYGDIEDVFPPSSLAKDHWRASQAPCRNGPIAIAPPNRSTSL